jgi:fatty acid desaturase
LERRLKMPYESATIETEDKIKLDMKQDIEKLGDWRQGALAFFTLLAVGPAVGLFTCAGILRAYPVLWLALLVIAPISAFFVVQLGFFGHSGGHRQLSEKPLVNDLASIAFEPFVGIVPGMWRKEHNKHHSWPNDPATDFAPRFPLISFSGDQFRSRPRAIRWITKYQAWYFPAVIALEPWGLHITSMIYLWKNRRERLVKLEALAFLAYPLMYLGFLIPTLGLLEAFAFMFVHKLVAGLYMGMVFAPNHKGMEVIEEKAKVSFLMRQLRTTRNSGFGDSWLITMLFGGLNYQIEHHLFPNVPYHRLGLVRQIVKRHCKLHDLPYYEVSVWRSFSEVKENFSEVGQTRLLPSAA